MSSHRLSDSSHFRNGSPMNKRELVDRYISSYNAFDVGGMIELLCTDVVFENYSNGELTAAAHGKFEFEILAQRAVSMFAERDQKITGFSVGPHSTVANIAYRGRLAIDVPGGPKAGTVLDLQGESEFHFEGDLIKRIIDRS